MIKVVYNRCYGGFDISQAAYQRLAEMGHPHVQRGPGRGEFHGAQRIPRHDARLVRVVEEMGEAANGPCAKLAIEEIEVPAYRIEERDGREDVLTPSDDWVYIGS